MSSLLLAASLLAPSLSVADNAETIHTFINRYYELGLFNGSALVADGGVVIMKRGYGLANMEWGITNMPDTNFRLGSVSKQFTAALIHYPRKTGDKITIHHLLPHTSGIPGYTELPRLDEWNRNSFSPGEFVKKFSDQELLFEPGCRLRLPVSVK